MSLTKKQIGRRFADQRRIVGVTQAQLAERIGVATETISRLETGAALPAVERLATIAGVLEIGLDDIFRQRSRSQPEDKAMERLVWLMSRRSARDIDLVITLAAHVFAHLGSPRTQ